MVAEADIFRWRIVLPGTELCLSTKVAAKTFRDAAKSDDISRFREDREDIPRCREVREDRVLAGLGLVWFWLCSVWLP